MKSGIFIIGICLPLLFGTACNKDKEKVAALEQEVQKEESKNLGLDSIKSEESVAETIDSGSAAAEITKTEAEFTPDKTPDEGNIKPREKAPAVKSLSETPAQTAIKTEEPIVGETVAGYVIQIGSGIDRGDAEKLMQEYIDKGYHSFISEKISGAITYYRVRIGSFDNIAEAKRIGQELKDKFGIDYWIDKGQ
jgi:cell division protein FtsN